jgi:2-oxoglutarate dehydrogenase E1 component
VQGEQFERFLHRTFVGAKRFSIEGGESLLAAIERVIQRAPGLSISDIIIGMAHRGRLNVLVNVLGKKPEQLFKAFSESYVPDTTNGDGDVKYHLGYENSRTVDGKSVALTLAYNPSHLEAVTLWLLVVPAHGWTCRTDLIVHSFSLFWFTVTPRLLDKALSWRL